MTEKEVVRIVHEIDVKASEAAEAAKDVYDKVTYAHEFYGKVADAAYGSYEKAAKAARIAKAAYYQAVEEFEGK